MTLSGPARQRPSRRPVLPVALGLAFALAWIGVAAQEGARLDGQVKDESGKPASGVDIVLEPTEGNVAAPVKARTDDRGRFAMPNVTPGSYRPRLESREWYMKSMEFSPRGTGGERLKTFKEDDVPNHGAPSITISGLQRGQLSLVVASIASAKDRSRMVAVQDATGRLKGLNALFEAQNWAALVPAADEVLAQYPDLGGARYLRAIGCWKLGRLDEAMEDFGNAYAQVPDQPGIRGVMGQAYLDIGDRRRAAGDEAGAVSAYSAAASSFAEERITSPSDPAVQTNLVIALDRAGRTEETLRELEKLIALAPERREPYIRLGDLQLSAEKIDEAIATYSRVPQGGEEAAIGIYNAAVVLWNAKNLEGTLAATDRAIALAPSLPYLYRLRANCFVALNRKGEAITALETAIRLAAPDDPETASDREALRTLKR